MSLTPIPRVPWRGLLLAVPFALGLFVANDVSALPGVGGLAKKAKEKAAKAAGMKQEEAVSNETIVFDDLVLELTGERLERIVTTYKSAKAAGADRPALVEKLNKTNEERGNHLEKNEEAIRKVREKRDDVEQCRHEKLDEMVNQKMQAYSQNALTDPTIREKFAKIAQRHNAAAMGGDSVAIKSAQDEMMAVIMPSREDTLGVYKKCDPMPPPLPAEGKLEDLDKQIASLSEKIRKVDEKISEAQAEHGEMTREQFAMAAERIQMYLSWRQSKSYSKSATRGFTSEEIKALEEYLEKLLAAMN